MISEKPKPIQEQQENKNYNDSNYEVTVDSAIPSLFNKHDWFKGRWQAK